MADQTRAAVRGEPFTGPLAKPEPRKRVKARRDRTRAQRWAEARAEAIDRAGGLCQRCHGYTSDELHECHPQRRHVNHTQGRRGDKLYDVASLEVLCNACHMPPGGHRRTA
jgi:5-methylcytosine-specific restriction endonuclease McrA